jgi:hypothetical protein
LVRHIEFQLLAASLEFEPASEPSASAIADSRAAASVRDMFSFCSNFILGMALRSEVGG